jgi:hypothetical protein
VPQDSQQRPRSKKIFVGGLAPDTTPGERPVVQLVPSLLQLPLSQLQLLVLQLVLLLVLVLVLQLVLRFLIAASLLRAWGVAAPARATHSLSCSCGWVGGAGPLTASQQPHVQSGRPPLLPHTLHADQFRQYFERFGKVIEAQIMVDHTSNRSRGFG